MYVAEEEIPLLEDIIRFVYTGKFQTCSDSMIHLLFVADKVGCTLGCEVAFQRCCCGCVAVVCVLTYFV